MLAGTGVKRLVDRRANAAVAGGGYDFRAMSMTNESLIKEAGRRLATAAPGAKVILFGSRARGKARPDSDLDLLVIEPDEVAERRAETARLRRGGRRGGGAPHGVGARAR